MTYKRIDGPEVETVRNSSQQEIVQLEVYCSGAPSESRFRRGSVTALVYLLKLLDMVWITSPTSWHFLPDCSRQRDSAMASGATQLSAPKCPKSFKKRSTSVHRKSGGADLYQAAEWATSLVPCKALAFVNTILAEV